MWGMQGNYLNTDMCIAAI